MRMPLEHPRALGADRDTKKAFRLASTEPDQAHVLAVPDCIYATSASFGRLAGEHHSAGRFILLSSAV
jgi:hypothetical protein